MTMIPQLLAVAMAIGLGVDVEGLDYYPNLKQPYKQHLEAIREATEILILNVASMEGHIPLLNDSRRHYAEIVYVVYKSVVPHLWDYDIRLNTTAPEAISDPEKVVAGVKYLLNEVHRKTKELKGIVDACHDSAAVCDERIEDFVMTHGEYNDEALIFYEAGRAANAFIEMNAKFEEVSNALKAHQYVCSSPGDLLPLMDRLSQLNLVLNYLSGEQVY